MSSEQGIVSGSPEPWPVRRLLLSLQVFFVIHAPSLSGQIQDNSFLLEEAYNQESGIVQHISTFQRSRVGGWEFGFAQEWPITGIRHQISYDVPIQNLDGFGTGVGDIGLNYRYQLAGNPRAGTLIAPRFTVILPTGDEKKGRGSGAFGIEGALPISLVLASQVVSHWNVGSTITPSALGPLGERATTTGFYLGGSVIWLVGPSFNFLVEALWESNESVVGTGRTSRENGWVLSPGFRMAFDLPSDLQIVPGLAYTVGMGSESEDDALFVYLSFEHPFMR